MPTRGDVREDGKVFYGLQKNRNGEYYEVWRDKWYAVKMLERRLRRKEIKKEYDAEYRATQGESRLKKKREYYLRTRDRDRPTWNWKSTLSRWRNPDTALSAVARRRARRKAATPPNARLEIIKGAYAISARVSECLGIKFHVDHIKALARGGLHHESNLQVIPGRINIIKSDSDGFVFDPL